MRIGHGVRAAVAATAGVVLTVVAAGCQTESSVVPSHREGPAIVVRTSDAAEFDILGQLYVNALTRSGVKATLDSQGGSQTDVLAAVEDGVATLTLGFTGDVLHHYQPGAHPVTADEVYREMSAALPEGLTAADPSSVEDVPTYVVTEATSTNRSVHSLSDLRGRCGEFAVGARAAVLEDKSLAEAVGTAYECSFGRRETVAGTARDVQGQLRKGAIGVGVMQSTDPVLRDPDMIPLTDPKHVIPAQRLVPVYRKGSLSEDQLTLVDRISGELTTDNVRELLLGAEFHTAPAVNLALYWLDQHGY